MFLWHIYVPSKIMLAFWIGDGKGGLTQIADSVTSRIFVVIKIRSRPRLEIFCTQKIILRLSSLPRNCYPAVAPGHK
jgi:hypothetical protein